MLLPRLRLLAAAVLLVVLTYLGSQGRGAVPPLGGFLEPANGVWALARSANLPALDQATIPGLTAAVEVVYDDRGVPHVFAKTEEDAWRAQGYLVARDRLFQMEVQARAGMGTLSELIGDRAVEADRTARRRGLPWAATRIAAAADSNSLIARAIRAHAAGVNAWIDGMERADVPLEYRLLKAHPFHWEPLYTYSFMNLMALTLAYQDESLSRLRVQALVGAAATEALFPQHSPVIEPIQPNGSGAPRYDFVRPMPGPGAPDSTAMVAATERQTMDLALGLSPRAGGDGDVIGSNNWTVAPSRTAAGHALLSGDPHLELTVPSIWYEIHLHSDDGLDVAGVTFGASPGVIIGFNRNLAWSVTNTGADVRDHYSETVDDDNQPTTYRLDGEWKPLEIKVEEVRGPQGRLLATDTLRFTHRGPMLKTDNRWISVRWTPYEVRGGDEFIRLDRSASVGEWLEAWKGYAAPAQNGVVADREGTIAIRSTGWYPIRPGNGRGDEIRDGSTASSDWTGYQPVEYYPFALNPAQGFLASANQEPVDPRMNGRYFGSNWPSPWRAMQINQLLRADSSVTPAAMQRFQTDPGSPRADAYVPAILAAARGRPDLASAAALLGEWDRRYTKDNRRAVLFESVMGELPRLLWDELIPAANRADTAALPVAVPSEAVGLELLADSSSLWWDDQRTVGRETRDDILAEALRRGLARAVAEHGPPEGEGWVWSQAHTANIYHALRIPALSALGLPVQGGPSTLSPSSGRGLAGPSWRMVVELGPEVRAWATYPGGQSGNPASEFYLDRIPKWVGGELDTLLFPKAVDQIPANRVRSRLTLSGRSGQ